ncbi:hypothetical protein FF52_06665 [Flavobacterium sp. F52]|nr:hypothetical protein FF52_06665 [Flavobacterium sp. F52]
MFYNKLYSGTAEITNSVKKNNFFIYGKAFHYMALKVKLYKSLYNINKLILSIEFYFCINLTNRKQLS